MTVRIIVHKKTKSVLADIGNHQRHFDDGIEQAWYKIGAINNRETKRLIESPPKTGVKYSSLPNRSSAPHQAPATQSGTLANSQAYKVSGRRLEVGETAVSEKGAPYPLYLEGGTSKMAPRPHLLKSVNNTARAAQQILGQKVWENIQDGII
jgi:hypothetical protein